MKNVLGFRVLDVGKLRVKYFFKYFVNWSFVMKDVWAKNRELKFWCWMLESYVSEYLFLNILQVEVLLWDYWEYNKEYM